MRVIAFSCAHFCTPATQVELGDQFGKGAFDYSRFSRFVKAVRDSPPDLVINLGDLNEPFYDNVGVVMATLGREFNLLPNVLSLRGNHDPNSGDAFVVIDGVRYEHGHAQMKRTYPGVEFDSPQEYNEALRELHAGQRIVHGHTHFPVEGWPFDVGSITFSGTYAEIVDGKPEMRSV